MTNEQVTSPSSIDYMRQFGAVTPSDRTRLGMDVKMQVDPNKDPKKEQELALRANRGRAEAAGEALLRIATKPYEVFYAIRTEVLPSMESGHKPDVLDSSYIPPSQLRTIDGRARDLSKSAKELQEMGLLLDDYDPESGYGTLVAEDISGYAISTTYIQEINELTGRVELVPRYYIGKENEREELAEAYKTAGLELEARAIEGWWVGLFLNVGVRDDLPGLLDIMHKASTKFKADHLKALFNLPGIKGLKDKPGAILKEIEGMPNPERNTEFGTQIEEGMFLTTLMLHSGSKQEMKGFLARPGAKVLITQIAAKSGMSEDDWRGLYIGNVDNWVDNPKDTDYMQDVVGDNLRKVGNRGLLTMYGNIAAYKGINNKAFSVEKQTKFIEKSLGSAIGSVEAAWTAVTFLKSIDTYSARGHSFLPGSEQVVATLGDWRYIEPTDTQKLYSLIWLLREGLKGRPSGLPDMLGKTPDMMFDLFDMAQVEVALPDGSVTSRSIWDAWLGTAEQVKRDIRTMKPSRIANIVDIVNRGAIEQNSNKGVIRMRVNNNGVIEERETYGILSREGGQDIVTELVKEEGYHRLGDLNFHSLPPDFHGIHNTIKWLAGRDGNGVMTATTETTFDPKKLTFDDIRKFWKYVSIVLNPLVLSKGSMHKFSFGGQGKPQDVIIDLSEEGSGVLVIPNVDGKAFDEIQHTFLNNLMLAKLNSEFFITQLAGDSFVKIPDVGGGGASRMDSIPLHRYVKAVMELMNGPFPKNLTELRNWRVDLMKLRSHSRDIYKDTIQYLESQTKNKGVGPVTGVNKFDK
jgi:hypothetical protein